MKKKIFMTIIAVVMQLMLTVGIYVVGAVGCELLYENTDWWMISDYEAMGAFMVVLQAMYWLSKGYKVLVNKIKNS